MQRRWTDDELRYLVKSASYSGNLANELRRVQDALLHTTRFPLDSKEIQMALTENLNRLFRALLVERDLSERLKGFDDTS